MLISAGRRSDAVEFFMAKVVGLPPEFVAVVAAPGIGIARAESEEGVEVVRGVGSARAGSEEGVAAARGVGLASTHTVV